MFAYKMFFKSYLIIINLIYIVYMLLYYNNLLRLYVYKYIFFTLFFFIPILPI